MSGQAISRPSSQHVRRRWRKYLAERLKARGALAVALAVALSWQSPHSCQSPRGGTSLGLGATGSLRADEIGYVEDFALAADRSVALKQLIPGTDDYYYYHALHYLNTEQYDKARELFKPWAERHNRTARLQEIELRLALLTYDKDQQKTLEYLRSKLNLSYPHQKEVVGAEPNLPVALDPQLIKRETLLQRAYGRNPQLNGIEDSALDWLVTQQLTPERRRHLLSRLKRPDYAGLPKLIIEDLNHPNSPGFGAFEIHRQLLIAQLEECVALKADLLNQTNFVQAYLTKLQPAADENWRNDVAVREAYLDRLWNFANRLAPVHNSLKAHVLYQRLVSDRARGVYDAGRFLTYLKLPRRLPYVSPKLLDMEDSKRHPVDLNSDFNTATLLPMIGNDEQLVRDYLAHFLLNAANYQEYAPYIEENYLKQLFAETKIVHGLGEAEQWASMLPPDLFQRLKDRVDIDFTPTNKTKFTADEPVTLDLHVKNVSTLIVKVFEINTTSFYRENLREIDTDINLDGLVANDEKTYQYAEPSLRRVARKFEFPQLKKPGVYVVDFIGNGRSSRALIRKGKLGQLVRTTPGGQRFTIVDDNNKPVGDARLWLAGREYPADKDGSILVPFSTDAERRPVVISRGEFSSLDFFQHEGESYSLAAGIYVDRESLLTRKKSRVVIRTGLSLNGTPITIKRLEDVSLLITTTDLDGVATTQEVPQLPLFEDRETAHEFQVPARLAGIQFVLRAKIQNRSAGKKDDLIVQESFTLNEINRSEKIEDLHLVRAAGKYFVELLGRTGEPKASRAVNFTFKHRDFQEPVQVTLKTDPLGRVQLGELTDMVSVTVTGPEGTSQTWPLPADAHTYPATIHGRVGELLTLPYLGSKAELSRDELSLLELRGETYVVDRFAALGVKNGLVTIDKLPAGDYDLWLKGVNHHVRVRVVAGDKIGNYVVGPIRQLETRPIAPLAIASITAEADRVQVALSNSSPVSRVHVFATRYVPAYQAYGQLAKVRDAEPYLFTSGHASSVYVTGRNIGDEYRYIIDRKYAKKFPGNTLERPALLLNPWAVRSTETGQVVAQRGDAFAAKGEADRSGAGRNALGDARLAAQGGFSDLDFLAEASVVLLNLTPDEKGVVTIPKAAIGTHQHLHVVAIDPLNTSYRSLTMDEPKTQLLDLRLTAGLDPAKHFTQQKQISLVPAGGAFEIADITTTRFDNYDSLARVYSLYTTLSKDPKLVEFRFLLQWPTMKIEEKRAQYSKYACHELNFFLAKKDPEFFNTVVKPYLANKKEKTFLDRWLLSENIQEFTRPWSHGQLNIAERILIAQRAANERGSEARHVADLFEMLPPNIDELMRLFDTAVKGRSLEASDQLGLLDALAKAEPARLGAVLEKAAQQSADGKGMPGMPGMTGKPRAASGAASAPPAPGAPAQPPGAAGGGFGAAKKDANADMVERESLKRKMTDKSAAMDEAAKSLRARDGNAMRRNEAGEAKAAERQLQENRKQQRFFDAEEQDRLAERQLYRKLDPTREWAENNYYQLPIDQRAAGLITVNAFWRDYAQHDPAQPFLSKNFAAASRNFSEMMLALAVLDLPFTSPQHEAKFDGRKMTLKAAGPMIVFHEEVKLAQEAAGATPILVSQNFFRHGDRQRVENGETVDKYVTDEFVVQTVYGCQVVVTNPTSSRQKLTALIQVPIGAIPVLNSQVTKTVHMTLEPYHTQTIDYHFYFPAAGKFAHFPVHVAKNEQLIAAAKPMEFPVVDKPSKIDTTSWDHVSQHGSNDEVLAFLTKQNIQRLNLDKIAFRMRDKAFFEATISLLSARRVYHPTLWSYALLHNSPAAIHEFLRHTDALVNETGGRLTSPLLVVDPVERRSYEHLEYKPLVNARAHALGKRRQIVNNRLQEQYHRLLKQLAYVRELTDEDWLAITYYLVLQDRVDEALATFAKVRAEKVATRMQYDYCAAYLDFFTADLAAARAIATKYVDHPVDRWRNTFTAVIAQLDEAEGKDVKTVDADDRNQQTTALAATEPTFDFTVEAKQVAINYQNLKTVRVNYYVMDVELLFSRNPFVQQFGGQFSAIRPNQTQEVTLPEKGKSHKIALPESLLNKNVLVEIVGGNQTKNQAYYSNSLSVQLIENYGQVKVTHSTTGKPVAKAYVKVYARTDSGEVKFYKDGYTDIRGRFEYASLSTNDLETAGRFSILILSDEFGASVREAAPPTR